MFLRPGESDQSRRSFTRRAIVLGGLQAAAFGALAGRLYQLQVMDRGLYVPLAERNRLSEYALAPIRGRILDRTGLVLADTRETYRCFVIPSLAGNLAKILEALSGVVALGPEEQRALVARARRQAPNQPIIVADDLTWEQVAQVNIHAPWLPGVRIERAGQRIYQGGKAMGHIVGYVGAVERFALDDKPALRIPGARVGKTGVERGMETVLAGESGKVRREVDARGHVVRQIARTEPTRGNDVVLSIDTELQRQVLSRLREYRRAAAVVVDARDGDVMALASTPNYDPAVLSGNAAAKGWHVLQKARDNPMFNRCIQGRYPPGSTFKMVTALAALEAGLLNSRETINCAGFVKVANHKFRCWNRGGHGPCNLHRALRESCDCYFYEISLRVGMQRIADMAHKLGLGETFENGLAGQEEGLIPDADWKRAQQGKGWYTGETLLASIGQGYVQATPLQLAVMTARLASGRAVEPSLARKVGAPRQEGGPGLGISERNLRLIRRAMLGVVNESSGTGKRARLSSPGLVLAGKTGTSQVSRLSSRFSKYALKWHLRDHALFVGYVAARHNGAPRFALSVIVEHGGGGGKTAAPLALRIAEDVLAHDGASVGERDYWRMVGTGGHSDS